MECITWELLYMAFSYSVAKGLSGGGDEWEQHSMLKWFV